MNDYFYHLSPVMEQKLEVVDIKEVAKFNFITLFDL